DLPDSPPGANSPNSADSMNTPNSQNRRPERLVLWVGFASAAAVLCFANRYLDDLTRQRGGTVFVRVVEEVTGVYAAAVLMPLIIMLARRYRLDRQGSLARIPIHVLAVATFSAVHTSMNWGLRAALFPAFGHGSYDYGVMRIRYFMEAPVDII